MRKEWRGFKGTKWTEEVNLRDFIQNNYTAYEGDESFLAEPTEATNVLGAVCRSCRRRSVPRVACSTWRQRLCQA